MLQSMERGEPPEALTDVPPYADETIYSEDLTEIWNPESRDQPP
jgi:hypothetical protein